jgi:hypothetical protein
MLHKVKVSDALVALAANSFKNLVLTQSEFVKGVTNEMIKDLKKSFMSGASHPPALPLNRTDSLSRSLSPALPPSCPPSLPP